mgnify:CR=1 FL=1
MDGQIKGGVMKHKTHHPVSARQSRDGLYYLYYPRGWIIVAFLLFSTIVTAQEQTPLSEFPIGSTIGNKLIRTNQIIYDRYAESGMNMIEQYASDATQSLLAPYDLCAANPDSDTDYIYHYSTAYYSKWEAEQDTLAPYVGVKHRDSLGNAIGDTATWKNIKCWSTKGLTSARDSLVYGPHYHQEKWYRRWMYMDRYDLKYIPRYRMALQRNDPSLNEEEDVCRIYVSVRHAPLINGVWNDSVYDHILKEPITLKVSDFPQDGSFKDFYFSNDPNLRWYQYPPEYRESSNYDNLRNPAEPCTVWVDIYGNNGVEFRVDWLRNDTKCDLYIDYIEIYDDFGWRQYLEDPGEISNQIKLYAQRYKTPEWSNIIYWIGSDEPFSLDAYTPIKTVAALLDSVNAPPLMIHFYPYWEIFMNADSHLVRYYNTVQPEQLNIHFFPFLAGYSSPRFEDWEAFRKQLQISYSLTKEKGFWYKAQNFGYDVGNNQWLIWRQPNPFEQNSEIMLALAHGIKGLVISHFDSFPGDYQGTPYTLQGLIKNDPPTFTRTELFYFFKDIIIPRLKGKLGTTLMKLSYTGNFLKLQYSIPTQPQPVSYDYLTLGLGQPAEEMNWHCGFFDRPQHPDDKYFMLANLIVTEEKSISVKILTSDPYPLNYSFRNVEGLFDTTIQAPNYLIKQLDYPPGEGYLYEFAPVIKYGGRLIYSEATQPGMILYDDMIIESGAVLTINGTYTSKGNITVKSGGIINGSNGKIQFVAGKKLITHLTQRV